MIRGVQRKGRTYGLLSRVGEGIRVGVNHLAFNLVCPATIVSDTVGDSCNVTFGHFNCFSIVKRFNRTQEVVVLFNQCRESNQELAPVLWCYLSPRAFKRFARRCYSNIDILLRSLMNRGNYFLSRRVDDLERLAIDTFNILVVNEPK